MTIKLRSSRQFLYLLMDTRVRFFGGGVGLYLKTCICFKFLFIFAIFGNNYFLYSACNICIGNWLLPDKNIFAFWCLMQNATECFKLKMGCSKCCWTLSYLEMFYKYSNWLDLRLDHSIWDFFPLSLHFTYDKFLFGVLVYNRIEICLQTIFLCLI